MTYLLTIYPIRYRFFDIQGAERRWHDDNPLLGSIKVEAVEQETGIMEERVRTKDKDEKGWKE